MEKSEELGIEARLRLSLPDISMKADHLTRFAVLADMLRDILSDWMLSIGSQ